MEHLFKNWERIGRRIGKNPVMMFLDFDGTLAPIADTPKLAALGPEVKELLKKISREDRIKLAFISGRDLKDIKRKVGLKNAIYSGNHGLEIEGPGIKFSPGIAPGYRGMLNGIKNELVKRTRDFEGALIEDKGLSVCLHYRVVDKGKVAALKTVFREAVEMYLVKDMIKVRSGKMVLEVMPPVEWDKGKVVSWLLTRQAFASEGSGATAVFYLGDDSTDEDAFKALEGKGITVLVGKPKGSRASYFLRDPGEVAELLRKVSVL